MSFLLYRQLLNQKLIFIFSCKPLSALQDNSARINTQRLKIFIFLPQNFKIYRISFRNHSNKIFFNSNEFSFILSSLECLKFSYHIFNWNRYVLWFSINQFMKHRISFKLARLIHKCSCCIAFLFQWPKSHYWFPMLYHKGCALHNTFSLEKLFG